MSKILTPQVLANSWVTQLQEFGFSYSEMLVVINLAKQRAMHYAKQKQELNEALDYNTNV